MHNKLYEKVYKFIKENLWFFIFLIFILVLFNIKLPYAIETPGGYISLNDRIKIDNDSTSSGDMGLTYVTMFDGTLPFLAMSYLNSDWDIVSNKDITYEKESIDDMNKREKIYMNEAISNAEIVAYKKANKNYNINDVKYRVAYIDYSDSELKVNDIINKINGIDVTSFKVIKNEINNTSDDYVNLEITRDDKIINVSASIYYLDGVKVIGVIIIPNYDISLEPNVSINMKDNESGPSGGLMTSLSIYDKLMNANLTKGDKISGTGTIDMEGNVGEIGGVKYKLIGAVKNNAKVFICPAENYEEAYNLAQERNFDIEVVSISTFEEAVNYLEARK